jgi:hypothetical protein
MTTTERQQEQDLDKTENDQQQVQGPRDATLCARYFAKHEAAYSRADVGGAVIEHLVWRQPGTSINRIDYVCLNGARLLVSGDLGDAIYTTGAHDLSWWTRCDLHYFAGKCAASEHGRGYRTWDDDAARRRLREEVARIQEDGEDVDAQLVSERRRRHPRWARRVGNVDARERGGTVRGRLVEFVPNFGVRPDQRCALHLIGLKAAMTQVAAATPAPSAVEVPRLTPTIGTPGDVVDPSRSSTNAPALTPPLSPPPGRRSTRSGSCTSRPHSAPRCESRKANAMVSRRRCS